MISRQFELGSVTIHMYGLIMGVAIVVVASIAALVAKRTASKFLKDDDVWGALWWVVFLGIVGARLYHVIDYWGYYGENWAEVFYVWNGGLGIYGGIVGGVVGSWLFSCWQSVSGNFLDNRRFVFKFGMTLRLVLGLRPGLCDQRKFVDLLQQAKGRTRQLLDAAAVGMPVGQAIGRMGNFINQELYGLPIETMTGKRPWWAVYIEPQNRLPQYGNYEYFQPLFAYEAGWSLLVFGWLWWLFKTKKWRVGEGKFLAGYLLMYAVGRTMLEGLRIEPWSIAGVPVAQIVGGVIILITTFYLVVNRKMKSDD